MATIALQKRPFDLFASYGHQDEDLVVPIVEWLRGAGLKVWFDRSDGDASKRNSDLLGNALASSRGAIFFLSPNWQSSTWCKDESEFALNERRADDAYLTVALRLAPFTLPPWFKLSNVIDVSTFSDTAAADLLGSLDPAPQVRLDNAEDVYFAGPWAQPSDAAKNVLRFVATRGWRLIGDTPDHPGFKDSTNRIRAIIDTCRGVLAVLPFRADKPPALTSPYVLDEVFIALRAGKPFLLFVEENVVVPQELASASFGGNPIPISAKTTSAEIQTALEGFDEELGECTHTDKHAFSFLATSILNPEASSLVKTGLESAAKLPCIRGFNLQGQHAQKAIIDRITNAAFCVADVSDDNKNSLIEAGVALGAGTALHLIAARPADGSLKRRFMFEDMEMNWYSSSLERLAKVYLIGRRYRRRVIIPR